MRLLWLCNTVPGIISAHAGTASGGGLWMDHVLTDLLRMDVTIRVLCLGAVGQGQINDRCSYRSFEEPLPYRIEPGLERCFEQELQEFQPDVIHIWGTEYGHTLSMMKAAEKECMLDRTVISIQGLCSRIARHYTEGVPHGVCRAYTFRDLVRGDRILDQQRKFVRRGALEVEALKLAHHVIGRTDWDLACTRQINPRATYHVCRETLREAFYTGHWKLESCQKHRIFTSSCSYPVKGFHYLLEALAQLTLEFPDVSLAVPGMNPREKSRLRLNGYDRYLIGLMDHYGLTDRVEFLGGLSQEQMKQQYLSSNVFVLCSTVENSPNSLGEAMLLGVPCVASDVGGVSSMLCHGKEGLMYQSTAPYMLADRIRQIFVHEEQAQCMGEYARKRALAAHDARVNLEQLLQIYNILVDAENV